MINEFLTGDTFFNTLGQNEFSPLLQNFSLALITILIPVSLAIFQYKNSEDFNKMVIINRVLKLDNLLIAVVLCFFPTLLWVFFTTNWFQLILFFIWAFGCQKLINIYYTNFRWLKGKQEDIKFEYISTLKFSDSDFTTAYEYLWRAKDSLKYKEREYINLFASVLEKLIIKNNYVRIGKLIDGFSIHLDNRTPIVILYSEKLLESLFKIHKITWLKSYQLITSNDITSWGEVDDVCKKVEELINKIFLLGLKNKKSHFFMTKYQKNINENLQLTVKYGKNSYHYVENTISSFIQILCSEQVDKKETYIFWNHEFPNEWKITKIGLTGPHSLVVMQLLNDYVGWFDEKLHKENKDFSVDSITRNLLPEVDPMIWLPLLDFSLHSFGESRVSSMVQRTWQFGLIGRVKTYTGSPLNKKVSNDFKNDRERTYELIYSLNNFMAIFSLSNLNKYLLELKDYKIQNELQKNNKKWLISVFTEMKEYIESLKKE